MTNTVTIQPITNGAILFFFEPQEKYLRFTVYQIRKTLNMSRYIMHYVLPLLHKILLMAKFTNHLFQHLLTYLSTEAQNHHCQGSLLCMYVMRLTKHYVLSSIHCWLTIHDFYFFRWEALISTTGKWYLKTTYCPSCLTIPSPFWTTLSKFVT